MKHTRLPLKLIRQVKGFMDEEEGMFLYEAAREASSKGPCLEVGSYCGKSAVYLGLGCKAHNGVLFSIDHHRGSEEQQPGQEYFDPELADPLSGGINTFSLFRKTIQQADLEDTIVPLVCTSALAARSWATPLSLIFIDGGHAWETVYTDYICWAGHLMPGGYLLIHDLFENPAEGGQAPFRAYQLALASGLFIEMPRVKTLGVLKKRKAGELIPVY